MFCVATTISWAQIVADFSKPNDAPLLKKISMYSTTIGSIDSYYERNDRDFKKILPLDASTYRLDLAMGKGDCWAANIVDGQPQNRTYHWTELDDWTLKCNQQNVMPYISWCYIPNPFRANANHRDLDESIPNWEVAWKSMHEDLARHVTEVSSLPVYHEIYNEPDLGDFFWNVLNIKDEGIAFLQRDDFNQRFNGMYKAAAQGIRTANADALVGGPAFAVAEKYTNDFLAYVKINNLPLDFYSMHQYRDAGPWPGRVNSVRTSLSEKGFSTTPLHISEYNFAQADWDNINWFGNHYAGASVALSYIKEIFVDFKDIEKIHWAQFLNAGFNGLGLIDYYGTKKAIYNAFAIIADMPVAGYELNLPDDDIDGMASADADKCTVVLWNKNTTSAKSISLQFSNVEFAKGTVRVYRIDGEHASAYDGGEPDLQAVEQIENISTATYTWSGDVPAEGVVYVVLQKENSSRHDFHPEEGHRSMAKFIKPHFYYYARGKTFWNHFDEKTWTAYVGSGNETGNVVAPVGVEADDLPNTILFNGILTGSPQSSGSNSLVGVQIDFHTTSGYTKAVLFHNQIYNAGRSWTLPWGKNGKEDTAVEVVIENFEVSLADYAPSGWDGRVIITTLVQDCGSHVALTLKMRDADDKSFCLNQVITFNRLSDKLISTAPFALAASASSGLPVAYEILSGPASVEENVLTFSGAGDVTIRAVQQGDGSFCETESIQTFTVADIATALDPTAASVITLYPNPTNDYITLDLGEAPYPTTIAVMDMRGVNVWESYSIPDSRVLNIDTRTFAPGLYLVRMVRNGDVITRRFAVVR